MNVIQQGIATLLKSAVSEKELALLEGFDIGAAYPWVKSHKIAPMIYDGALRCGISQQHPIMQTLFQSYCKALQLSERQMQALDRIYAAFDAHGIEYMPLKGSMMKALYPKPELRMMGDADILIRVAQYDRIAPIMEQLGFHAQGEAAYDFTWVSDSLHLELHKSVFGAEEADFHAYFGDGWSLAKIKEGTRFSMTAEDSFIYMFAHFAKHYRGAGIGCRHVVDLWVFLRKNGTLDESYIKGELEKLHLLAFYQNMRRTLSMWFEGGGSDEKADVITDVIFANGNWGTVKRAALSQGVRDTKESQGTFKGRVTYIIRRVFPSFEMMRLRYPVLKNAPVLLPAMWILHLFRKLVSHRISFNQHMKNVFTLTKENLKTHRQMLEFVGLDNHF